MAKGFARNGALLPEKKRTTLEQIDQEIVNLDFAWRKCS